MKIARISLFKKFLFCAILLASLAQGQENITSNCRNEFEENQSVIVRNDYKTNRGMEWYVKFFSDRPAFFLGIPGHDKNNAFLNFLARLGPNDHILDAGSGETMAMAQYLGIFNGDVNSARLDGIFKRPKENKADVTAVSFKVSEGIERILAKEKKLQLHTGKYFEDIDDKTLLAGKKKFKAIFDVYGVLSYSSTPDVVLEKYFRLLHSNGVVFVKTGPRDLDDNVRPRSSMYRSQVRTASGEVLAFPDWIKRLPGLHVVDINNESIGIQVIDMRKVKIPKLLLVECIKCPNPPQARIFKEIPAPQPTPARSSWYWPF